MSDKQLSEKGIFVLKVSRKGEHLEVSAFERRGPVRSFVEHHFREEDVAKACQAIATLFNKSNRQGEISSQELEKLKAQGHLLYDELLPLSAKQGLQATRAEYLILDIDDKLNHLPWELLFDGASFLCLRFSMGRIVRTMDGGQIVARQRAFSCPLKMLILFDPQGDLAASYAKGESSEGEMLVDFLAPQKTLTVDFKGSPIDSGYVKMYLRDYDLVHYAGHAEYDSEDMGKSGWVLADKKLLASDIIKMLGGEKSLPALVFSNACQSAIAGKCETANIYDLAKAFLISGVQHYIGTLWDILNKPSSHFALFFYQELAKGKSIGQALKDARQNLIQSHGEKNIIWASYVLYGDPTATYLKTVVTENQPVTHNAAQEQAAKTPVPVLSKPAKNFKKAYFVTAGILSALLLIWLAAKSKFLPQDDLWQQKYNAALSYMEAGNYDAAINLSRGLEQRYPHAAHIILGDVYFIQGNFQRAVLEYTNAAKTAEIFPMAQSLAYNRLGRIYSRQGEYAQALDYYNQAISSDDQYSEAYVNKGLVFEKTGDYKQAQEQFSQAVNVNPEDKLAILFKTQAEQHITDREDSARNERINKLISELTVAYHKQLPHISTIEEKSDAPLTITFLNFKGSTAITAREGEDEYILLKTVAYLNNSGKVKVVERALVENLLEELKLGSSELANPQVSIKLGQILAAKLIISGNIVRGGDATMVGMRLIETETTGIKGAIAEKLPKGLSLDETARILADKILECIQRE